MFLSFALAWVLHWMQCRLQTVAEASWLELCLDACFVGCLLAVLAYVARKQYLKFTRQIAALATSRLVHISEELDDTIKESIRYIQEIEVVARGYDLSNTLPPISRLDGDHAQTLCRELRRLAAKILYTGITQFIHFHNELQPLVSPDDMRTYYHIYELSPDDFSGAVSFANDMSPEAQETLKQLRFLSQLHSFARKFFLVDLLALRTTTFWDEVQRWRKVTQVVKSLVDDVQAAAAQLRAALTEDDTGNDTYGSDEDAVASPIQLQFVTPERQQSKAQMRRFEGITHGVRALGARTRIARDEITDLISRDATDRVVNATIVKHYDSLGEELRSLLDEWTRGRSAMTLFPNPDGGRDSRPLSEMRTPLSPSPSLGGLTMVEGSPADALKLLNGETDDHDTTGDEEIFEASSPPNLASECPLALT
ncbi:uncharacterized protein AB675_10645 [Cyphellophora attinorum]|uniref:Myosin-binding domain-containing protein n=1 Tax=Cyphellophora attinorum TaxID=1664694 RepID=A0A0N0NMM4_9EURO|nr:uncharacterized protein AB675_10645 [Phialophora attinorum]KPI40631.1 hypothetical protein AB675_10645 [Phialophora attinorum]